MIRNTIPGTDLLNALAIGDPNGDIMNNGQPKGNVSVAEILAYLEQDHYLSKKEAAKHLALSIRTLDKWLHAIPHFRVGKKALFKKSELDKWMEHYRERPQNIDLRALLDESVRQALGEEEYSKRRRRRK
jgi:excisionase family DNA binding protein